MFCRWNITVHSCCGAATLCSFLQNTTTDLLNLSKQHFRRFHLFSFHLLGRQSKINLFDLHWITMEVLMHRAWAAILFLFCSFFTGFNGGLFLVEMPVHINMYLSLDLYARLPIVLLRLKGIMRSWDWNSLWAVIHGWNSIIFLSPSIFVKMLRCLDI